MGKRGQLSKKPLIQPVAASSSSAHAEPEPPRSQAQSYLMSEEITYYDEELVDLVNEVGNGIDGLRRLKGPAKLERVSELNGRLQRARQTLQSFKVEMRELPREQLPQYDARAKEHHGMLQQLHADLQQAKSDAERGAVGLRSVDEMSTAEVIQTAHKTQDQSLSAVRRMQQNIADTKEVGAETAAKLKAQTEQLQNIDVDIMKVKSNLHRADLLLRAFVRRMMTDKIVLVFMCLIFCGVIAIIAYKIVDPNGGGGDDDAPSSTIEDPMAGSRRMLFGSA